MNVKDLINLLSAYNPDLEVVLQKDSEGNGYSPLSGAAPAYYEADSTYSGSVYAEDDTDEPDNCVVLWPIN